MHSFQVTWPRGEFASLGLQTPVRKQFPISALLAQISSQIPHLYNDQPELLLATRGASVLGSNLLRTYALGGLPQNLEGSLARLIHPEDLGLLLPFLRPEQREVSAADLLAFCETDRIELQYLTQNPISLRVLTAGFEYCWLHATVYHITIFHNLQLNFITFHYRPQFQPSGLTSECEAERDAGYLRFLLNHDGSFAHVSPASLLVLGHHSLELANRPLAGLAEGEQIFPSVDSHQDSSIPATLRKKDGSELEVEIRLEWLGYGVGSFAAGVAITRSFSEFIQQQLFGEVPQLQQALAHSEEPFFANLTTAAYDDLGFQHLSGTSSPPQVDDRFYRFDALAQQQVDPEQVFLPFSSFTGADIGASSFSSTSASTSVSSASSSTLPSRLTSPQPVTPPSQKRTRERSKSPASSSSPCSSSPSSTEKFQHRPQKRRFKRVPLKHTDRECLSCHTDTTPEWRKGPNGPKTLCNACGLQFAKVSKGLAPDQTSPFTVTAQPPAEPSSKRRKRPKKTHTLLALDE